MQQCHVHLGCRLVELYRVEVELWQSRLAKTVQEAGNGAVLIGVDLLDDATKHADVPPPRYGSAPEPPAQQVSRPRVRIRMKCKEARENWQHTGIRERAKVRYRRVIAKKREHSAECFRRQTKRVGRILIVRELVLEGPVHVTASDGEHASQYGVLPWCAEPERPYLVDETPEIAGISLSECGVERTKYLCGSHSTASAVNAVKDLPQDALIVGGHDGDRDFVLGDHASDFARLVHSLVFEAVVAQFAEPVQKPICVEEHRHGEPMRRRCSTSATSHERFVVQVKVELKLRGRLIMLDQGGDQCGQTVLAIDDPKRPGHLRRFDC